MMTRMSAIPPASAGRSDTSDPGHLVHVIRPRGSVALGVIAVVAALVLLAYSGGAGLGFMAALALMGTMSFVLLVRPHVRVSIEGVAVHNPFRRTFVPWRLLEDVGSRWNLELYAANRTVRVWAISNPMIRPKVGVSLGFGGIGAPRAPGREDALASSGSSGAPGGAGAAGDRLGPASAPRVARLVEAAKADWVDAVDEGIVAEPLSPRIIDRWDFWDLGLAVVPALAWAFAAVGR
jgi:hypothetical protein